MRLGLAPTDLKLITAVLVVLALSGSVWSSSLAKLGGGSGVLRISQLRKVFSNGSGVEMTALDNVNLDVRPGDFITIIGSNGAGKSTLLNVIAGVYEVDEGEIWIDGENVTNQPEYRRAHLIGRVFQDPMIGTAASMTIEENLAMAMKRAKRLRLVPGVTARIEPGFGSSWRF